MKHSKADELDRYLQADIKTKALRRSIKKAKSLGFNSLSHGVISCHNDTDAFPTKDSVRNYLGLSHQTMTKYLAIYSEMGFAICDRVKIKKSKTKVSQRRIEDPDRNPVIKKKKKADVSISHLLNSMPSGTWDEPKCDPLGLIRGFCK